MLQSLFIDRKSVIEILLLHLKGKQTADKFFCHVFISRGLIDPCHGRREVKLSYGSHDRARILPPHLCRKTQPGISFQKLHSAVADASVKVHDSPCDPVSNHVIGDKPLQCLGLGKRGLGAVGLSYKLHGFQITDENLSVPHFHLLSEQLLITEPADLSLQILIVVRLRQRPLPLIRCHGFKAFMCLHRLRPACHQRKSHSGGNLPDAPVLFPEAFQEIIHHVS